GTTHSVVEGGAPCAGGYGNPHPPPSAVPPPHKGEGNPTDKPPASPFPSPLWGGGTMQSMVGGGAACTNLASISGWLIHRRHAQLQRRNRPPYRLHLIGSRQVRPGDHHHGDAQLLRRPELRLGLHPARILG